MRRSPRRRPEKTHIFLSRVSRRTYLQQYAKPRSKRHGKWKMVGSLMQKIGGFDFLSPKKRTHLACDPCEMYRSRDLNTSRADRIFRAWIGFNNQHNRCFVSTVHNSYRNHQDLAFTVQDAWGGDCALNPFRTAVPFWGQASQISSSLSPKRDCGALGVKRTSPAPNLPKALFVRFKSCDRFSPW